MKLLFQIYSSNLVLLYHITFSIVNHKSIFFNIEIKHTKHIVEGTAHSKLLLVIIVNH